MEAKRWFEKLKYTEVLHAHPYQQCVRCVMDTSDPEIEFDAEGICNHCHKYDAHVAALGSQADRAAKLASIISECKASGVGRDYDCIMGLSGGVDSSFLVMVAVKEWGLRPLVVHVDAGWNSELAVENIQNIVTSLNLDLHTLVINWPEVRDIQRAYFLSGIANLDVAQDHAFNAALNREARRYGIRHVLTGGNMQTESILPGAWGYDASDSTSLKAIHARYGTETLKQYPMMSPVRRYILNPYFYRLKVHRPLEYLDYVKSEAKKILIDELGWRDYGGKHFESVFTKFFQAYYLPERFGYDKRLAHLSSLIVSGQLSRDAALTELAMPRYPVDEFIVDKEYWLKKLKLSEAEFLRVMEMPPVTYKDFPTSEWVRELGKRAVKYLRLVKGLGGVN